MREHQLYKCVQPCQVTHCNICDGGLALCTVCNGAEASLTTECPGRKISDEEQDQIVKGNLDYNEDWINKENNDTCREYQSYMESCDESEEKNNE